MAAERSETGRQVHRESLPQLPMTVEGCNVFLSHDSRDAAFAEAFAQLLKSVSSGMIKTFRSSDQSPGEGVAFGQEWYKHLMEQLARTTDVVCIFTERSLGRPWILFEAGVAKGKLDTSVIGLAVGVPLSQVNTGPFYQFMNSDGTDPSALTKLLHQLARRVSGLELDSEILDAQIRRFIDVVRELLGTTSVTVKVESSEEAALAQIADDVKSLPARVAERVAQIAAPRGIRRMRRMPLPLIHEIIYMGQRYESQVGVLIVAGLFRDELPWLYELLTDFYRSIRAGNPRSTSAALLRLREGVDLAVRVELLATPYGAETRRELLEIMRTIESIYGQTSDRGRPRERSSDDEDDEQYPLEARDS